MLCRSMFVFFLVVGFFSVHLLVFLVCLVMLLGNLCLVVVFVSCLVVIVVSVLLCILSKVHWFCLLFSVLCFFVEFYFKLVCPVL